MKIPFAYLSAQVDKLYERQFDLNNIFECNNHCTFIQYFILASGWSIDEYIRAMFGFEENQPDFTRLQLDKKFS
mgnify:FL=1